MPFIYKKAVFDAAITASLLYSAESWLTDNIKPIERQYNFLVRSLLGVRNNTSIDLCLLESGIPPLINVLATRRCKYISSKLESLDEDQPFTSVFRLCQVNNTPAYKALSNCLRYNFRNDPLVSLRNSISDRALQSTKFNTYMSQLNTSLSLHPIYVTQKYIPDYLRESFSRIRLMSHNLKIETGRWSRIPRERRTCICDNECAQTEIHVLIECRLTQRLRHKYSMLNYQDINSLFGETIDILSLCKYTHDVLKLYT